MANALSSFDPVGAFQRGRSGARAIERQEQQIAAQPLRNELAGLQVQQAQQALSQQETTFGQSQAIQRATILDQTADALGRLPQGQRRAAFDAFSPELSKFNIDPSQFANATFTDQELAQARTQARAFISSGGDPFTLSPGQERFTGTGQRIAGVAPKPTAFQLKPGEQRFEGGRVVATGATPQVPPEFTVGLDEDVAAKGAAAFSAAGGGNAGVKAFSDAVKTAVKKKSGAEAKRQQAGIVSFDIDRALDQSQGAFTTGFTGSLVSSVPGTPAFDLKATLDGIKANVGFGQLQQMRENSPTGGALGSVSENENRLLQSVLGNVEQSQSEEQLTRNLSRLKVIFDAVVNGSAAMPFTQEQFDALPPGTRYISPDTGTLHEKR